MLIKENYLEVGSLKWFYRQITPESTTEQIPVVMLHGLPAHSYMWRGLMESLAQQGIVAIAPDWIGSGFSAKPDKRDFAYTPQAYLDAFGELITALELEQLHLVVQGFLGHIGLQYALNHPEQITSLIILNTPLSPSAKLPFTMQQWGWPFAGDMLTQDPLLVDRSLENGSGFVISDENLAKFRKPYLKTSAVGRALLTTIKKLQLSQTLTKIQSGFTNWEKPTLIVWGMADPWLQAEDATNLTQSLANGKLIELAEAKHYPQEHWYQEMSEPILSFLRRSSTDK